MPSPYDLPADVPKTDRELLLMIHNDMLQIKERLEGRDGHGGLCAEVSDQAMRIQRLENWRWYLIGGLSIITFLLVALGRYIDIAWQH